MEQLHFSAEMGFSIFDMAKYLFEETSKEKAKLKVKLIIYLPLAPLTIDILS